MYRFVLCKSSTYALSVNLFILFHTCTFEQLISLYHCPYNATFSTSKDVKHKFISVKVCHPQMTCVVSTLYCNTPIIVEICLYRNTVLFRKSINIIEWFICCCVYVYALEPFYVGDMASMCLPRVETT